MVALELCPDGCGNFNFSVAAVACEVSLSMMPNACAAVAAAATGGGFVVILFFFLLLTGAL